MGKESGKIIFETNDFKVIETKDKNKVLIKSPLGAYLTLPKEVIYEINKNLNGGE